VRLTILDTGPIVGWLRADDPDHKASVEALRRSAEAGRRLATTWEVVGEAYTLMRHRLSKTATPALQVLRWAATAHVLGAEQADQVRAHALLARHLDLKLSYVDALVLAVAERSRADEIITLDAELTAVRLSRPTQVTVL
jgi:predicted nucleic acid-binding protein